MLLASKDLWNYERKFLQLKLKTVNNLYRAMTESNLSAKIKSKRSFQIIPLSNKLFP